MNLKKIIGFAVGPIGSSALGLITVPIIAWLYSSEDIGRLAVLQVVMSSAVLLFSLGLDQAYIRNYHESRKQSQLLKTSITPGALLLISTLLIFNLFPGSISKLLFDIDSISISLMVTIYIIAGFLTRFISIILRMQEKGLAFSFIQLLPKVLLLIIIGCYASISTDLNFYYLIVASVASTTAAAVFFIFTTKSTWLKALNDKIDKEQIKPMLMFGIPLIISGLSYWGLTAMNTIFMRNTSTFDQLAIYSVAISFASVGSVFRSIFSTIWAPTVYKWEHEGVAVEKIKNTTDQITFSVSILFCVTALLSSSINLILPDKYSDVQYILISCMAYPLFYTLSEATGIGSGILRKSSHTLYSSIAIMAANFVAIYLLVPIYGAAGAAVSTALSSWLFLVLRTEISAHTWKKTPRLKTYITTLACLALSVSYTLKGSEHPYLFPAIWFIFLLVIIISFKKTSATIAKYITSR